MQANLNYKVTKVWWILSQTHLVLPASSVKLAGGVEATAAALFAASFLNKNISRLGSLATISVLSVAAYKHFEAGHGKKVHNTHLTY